MERSAPGPSTVPPSPTVLALYELKDATLNGHAGQGYVYPIKTYKGREYRGVFFASEEEPLNAAAEAEEVAFEGTVYKTTTANHDTVTVDVTKVVSVGIGMRADFTVKE